MKKIILFLIVIVAVASSCKKSEYEQTLKKIYGEYTLKTYTVNGVDSLSLFRDSLGTNFDFYRDDVNSFNVLKIDGPTTSAKYGDLTCRWKLVNNKTLSIYISGGAFGTGPFGRDKTPEWEILILFNNNKIWMKTNYNGKEYLIELE